MEQPQYNMFERYKMELEYPPIFHNIGMGTTIFSPLAAGFLSGKYQGGIPEGTRLSMEGFEWLKRRWLQEDRIQKVTGLTALADRLDTRLASLAIAWTIKNPNVTTAILGATKKEQLLENLTALEVLPRLTPAVVDEIEGILQNKPYFDAA
jgi:aryl-alcohol dehydrogenase-like predicted oxidoreductase